MYASTRNTYLCQHEKLPEYVVIKTVIYKSGLRFNLNTVHDATTQISEHCNIPYERVMPHMLNLLQQSGKRKAYKAKKEHNVMLRSFRFVDRICPTGLSFEKAFFKAREYDVINLQRSTKKTMMKRLDEYEKLYLEQAEKDDVPPFP